MARNPSQFSLTRMYLLFRPWVLALIVGVGVWQIATADDPRSPGVVISLGLVAWAAILGYQRYRNRDQLAVTRRFRAALRALTPGVPYANDARDVVLIRSSGWGGLRQIVTVVDRDGIQTNDMWLTDPDLVVTGREFETRIGVDAVFARTYGGKLITDADGGRIDASGTPDETPLSRYRAAKAGFLFADEADLREVAAIMVGAQPTSL